MPATLRLLALHISVFLIGCAAADAATITMKCKNPRREYLVEFDEQARRLVVRADGSTTNYPISAIQEITGGLLISGRIPNGPQFQLSTGKQKMMRYTIAPGNEQADQCQ